MGFAGGFLGIWSVVNNEVNECKHRKLLNSDSKDT